MEKCKHLTLTFGSGGFYIICTDCHKFWVAVDHSLGEGDKSIDYTRNDGLGMMDIRTVKND